MDDAFGLRARWQEAATVARKVIAEAYADGDEAAEAEAAYQAAKAQKAAEMRADGTPVGIVDLAVKGAINAELLDRERSRNAYRVDMAAISFYTNLEAHTYRDYERAMKGDGYGD